jgi:hypothetical protein
MSTHVATFDSEPQYLVIADVRCRLKHEPGLLRWIALPVRQRFGVAICRDGGKILIERFT